MQYRLSYVEEVKKASNISWAIRQTGVYHRHMPTGPGSLWIFLHPRPNSTLQTRLEKSIKEWSRKQRSLIELQLVHLIPLSSYIGDWRWYLKNLSAEIETFASIAMSIDFSKEGYHGRGTNTLQSLHNLQDKVSPLFARLRSTLRTVASLKRYKKSLNNSNNSIPAQTKEILGELESYETSLHGNLASVTLLERRTQEILNLLVVALNLKSQATAVKINRNIWSLTKDTVDDSATVRLVTMVTLIYLPASFVTVGLSPIMPGAKLRSSQQSLLGMNLFTFQTTEGSGFQVSKQFWLFFAILIPLTLLTIGSWIIMARRIHERKRRDREKAESTGPIDEDLWPSTH
ncbi:hypothetical protein B0J14DRAFT_297870 [Halenospora varia]|nr:hypothetical protein B0J14DRAFT_297870 [Halenospora varia]